MHLKLLSAVSLKIPPLLIVQIVQLMMMTNSMKKDTLGCVPKL
jgi:hypothetical protein